MPFGKFSKMVLIFPFEGQAAISKHGKGEATSRPFAQLALASLIGQRSRSVSLLIDFICAIASNTKSRSALLTQECFFIADVFVRNRQPSVLMSFPGTELTHKKFVPVYFILYGCIFFFLFQSDHCNRTVPGVKIIGKSIDFTQCLQLIYRIFNKRIIPEIEFYPTGIFL